MRAARWAMMVMAGLGLLAPAGAVAQGQTPAEALAAGRAAVEAGDSVRALAVLRPAFDADPAAGTAEAGTVAYWLGRAYAKADRPDSAVAVWGRGAGALAAKGRVDLRLADALVWEVFARRDSLHYPEAAAAYLALLAHLDGVAGEALRPVRVRHLAPLAFILPDDVRAETGLDSLDAVLARGLPPGAGSRLAAWWRSVDLLPATPANERLYEHLERVTFALDAYRHPLAPLGFDDRARLYIRLGPPTRRVRVQIDQNEPLRPQLSDPLVPFYPEGEFWVYDHIDDAAQYLFARERGKPYALATPTDLVPPSVSGQRSSLRYITSMMDIYRMLALYHPKGHYGSLYEQIENYVGLLEDYAIAGRMGVLPNMYRAVPPAPRATIFSMLSRGRAEDRHAIRVREERVPRAYSNVLEGVDLLPVDLRWARFLEPDGTTRVEVYWTLRSVDLLPTEGTARRLRKAGFTPSDRVLLQMNVLRQASDYRTLARDSSLMMIHEPGAEADGVLPVRTYVVDRLAGTAHVALAWDAYWAAAGAEVARGPRFRTGAYRLEGLAPLDADPGRLEMSDLKPLRLRDDTQPLDQADPFPHATVTPDVRLGLYFEVYHLAYGPDDRTHYTVAYEVVREEHEGGLLRLRKQTVERRTVTTTSYTGDDRTARETVFLDLNELSGPGRFEVHVHVTDEVTGQSVARSLAFDVRE